MIEMTEYLVPQNLLYTKTHEWAKLTEDGLVIVGITDYAQKSLHEVVYVDLPEVGKKVKAGDAFMSVESVKAVSEIFSPVTGEIIEVNSELNMHPEKVNEQPYGSGWLVKIKPTAWQNESKALLNPEQYKKVIQEERT